MYSLLSWKIFSCKICVKVQQFCENLSEAKVILLSGLVGWVGRCFDRKQLPAGNGISITATTSKCHLMERIIKSF